MHEPTALLFPLSGSGEGLVELTHNLAGKYLSLLMDSDELPGWILFEADGVKLGCQGSPGVDQLRAREIAASITCLELTVEPRYFEEYTAALFLPHTDLTLFPSCTT